MCSTSKKIEIVTPLGDRVLIRREAFKRKTKEGIYLPENTVIPTLIGRVIGVSAKVESDPDYADIKIYARVLFNPSRQIPVDFEMRDTPLVVIPVEDVVAVINNQDDSDGKSQTTQGRSGTDVG